MGTDTNEIIYDTLVRIEKNVTSRRNRLIKLTGDLQCWKQMQKNNATYLTDLRPLKQIRIKIACVLR